MNSTNTQLRSHPLMNYRGFSNWPPTWTEPVGWSKDVLNGELGTLDRVFPSRIEPDCRIFLVMKFNGTFYMATLLFRDAGFCRLITRVLQAHLGMSMKEIGDLVLPSIP